MNLEVSNLLLSSITINSNHVASYINLARAETILENEEVALATIENARNYGAPSSMIASLERQREQIKHMRISTIGR